MIKFAICVIAAYLLGSISPSIIIGRLRGDDIRSHGSGNAGTTNVLRNYGKKAAAVTLLVDVLKGTAAAVLGSAIGGGKCGYACALAVLLGHIFPVFFGFKGGKGVATAFGALLGVSPWIALAALAVFVCVCAVSRYVSLSSICAAASAPLASLVFAHGAFFYVVAMAAVIIIKHRTNISRLFAGTENKLKF